jgi:hypothetical protein
LKKKKTAPPEKASEPHGQGIWRVSAKLLNQSGILRPASPQISGMVPRIAPPTNQFFIGLIPLIKGAR